MRQCRKAVKLARASASRTAAVRKLTMKLPMIMSKRRFYHLRNRAGGIEGGITNGEEIRVVGYLKPIPTLKKALRSVDMISKEPFLAQHERSDTCTVPAAGVIGESMVALVLAAAFLEKFGGDSVGETQRNLEGYLAQLRNY